MYDSRLIWREPVLTHAISALHWWLRWTRFCGSIRTFMENGHLSPAIAVQEYFRFIKGKSEPVREDYIKSEMKNNTCWFLPPPAVFHTAQAAPVLHIITSGNEASKRAQWRVCSEAWRVQWSSRQTTSGTTDRPAVERSDVGGGLCTSSACITHGISHRRRRSFRNSHQYRPYRQPTSLASTAATTSHHQSSILTQTIYRVGQKTKPLLIYQ